MRLQYDPSVDMGYLHLHPHQSRATVARSIPWSDAETRSELVLDFDAEGRLVGIELFSASRLLRPDELADAVGYPTAGTNNPTAPDGGGADPGE